MRVEYTRGARVDLQEAYAYYENRRTGLGAEFLNQIEHAISDLAESPLRWRKIDRQFRRFLVKRFPYGVIYRVLDERVEVAAIMHLQRRPLYWRDRKN